MKFKKKYSAKEFANVVGEKEANIHTLRKRSRNIGVLNNNESLTEDFLAVWDVARKLHYDQKVKWDDAIDHALASFVRASEEEYVSVSLKDEPQSMEERIDEILSYLKKSVTLLEVLAQK